VTKDSGHESSWVSSELLAVLQVKITVCWNMAPWSCFDYPQWWGSNLFRNLDYERKTNHHGVTFQLCNLQIVLCFKCWGGGGLGGNRKKFITSIYLFVLWSKIFQTLGRVEFQLFGLFGTVIHPDMQKKKIPDNWILLWKNATLAVWSSAVTIYTIYSNLFQLFHDSGR
jgi:hypothetical protein